MKKGNPFEEDPICKLNLKETSEFVKSLPTNNDDGIQSVVRRRSERNQPRNHNNYDNNNNNDNNAIINTIMSRRSMEATPSTPGRPIFGFSVPRRSVPSKWEDAEKWLIGAPSHDFSPARHADELIPQKAIPSPTRHAVLHDEVILQKTISSPARHSLNNHVIQHGELIQKVIPLPARLSLNNHVIQHDELLLRKVIPPPAGHSLNNHDYSANDELILQRAGPSPARHSLNSHVIQDDELILQKAISSQYCGVIRGSFCQEESVVFGDESKVVNCEISSSVCLEENYYHHNNEFDGAMGPTDVTLKDKYTDEIDPITSNMRYLQPTKEAFLFKSQKHENEAMKDECKEVIPFQEVKHRDIDTEMTPLDSSTTSRCHTPYMTTSPPRPNTPASRSGPLALVDQCTSPIDITKQLQECHLAKLQSGSSQFDSVPTNWSSREEEEEEVSKSLRHFEVGRRSVSVSESRVSVWEEEEKTKSCLRYQREEAKIQAWLNLQTAKAEAQSRKLEVKIQKMRSDLEEKLMKRMANVHRKAEEWRAAAQVEHSEQIRKANERVHKQHLKLFNSHFSPYISSCGCFPCTNSIN